MVTGGWRRAEWSGGPPVLTTAQRAASTDRHHPQNRSQPTVSQPGHGDNPATLAESLSYRLLPSAYSPPLVVLWIRRSSLSSIVLSTNFSWRFTENLQGKSQRYTPMFGKNISKFSCFWVGQNIGRKSYYLWSLVVLEWLLLAGAYCDAGGAPAGQQLLTLTFHFPQTGGRPNSTCLLHQRSGQSNTRPYTSMLRYPGYIFLANLSRCGG